MNRINFLGQSQFPWSSDTFDFQSKIIELVAKLSYIGGSTYILTGCEENVAAGTVSPGVVVINGETLPFTGGQKQNNVYIKEVSRDVMAQGYSFPSVYVTRTVEFGLTTNHMQWTDFKRIDTNQELSQAIADLKTELAGLRGIPAKAVIMWSGSPSEIPDGWSLCDGRNGTPNLQGMFIVGYSTTDNDYNAIGNKGGAKDVTLSIAQMPAHTHHIKGSNADNGDPGTMATTAATQPNEGMRTESEGNGNPHENRPPYYTLAFIMKL